MAVKKVVVLGLKQLMQKKYRKLEGLPEDILKVFGELCEGFSMLVWGRSASGKSNFLMVFIKCLMVYGKVLYIGLEEGFNLTMQNKAGNHMNMDDHNGKVEFANHTMTIEALYVRLRRRKSPKFIVIDSLQYWGITYPQYQKLKEDFPDKSFIYISHAKGRDPDGKTGPKIQYDVDIKVWMEGGVAHVASRYHMRGDQFFVIDPVKAKKYWGRKLKGMVS